MLTRLVGLLVLDLSSNALQALPGVLGCLRHLKKLNLRNNAFESLTMEALAGMAKLEVMWRVGCAAYFAAWCCGDDER